jgi:hypothetical protein
MYSHIEYFPGFCPLNRRSFTAYSVEKFSDIQSKKILFIKLWREKHGKTVQDVYKREMG